MTLVTYQFLHANILHIFGNMLFLWIFGDDVEEAMGPLRFLVFYLVLRHRRRGWPSSPARRNRATPLIGASGAIAGVLAAYLMFKTLPQSLWSLCPGSSCGSSSARWCGIDAFWVLGAWILTQFWSISVQAQDGVAYMAHIGGLAGRRWCCFRCCVTARKLFECIRRRGDAVGPPPETASVRRSINVDRPMARPLASARSP